MKPVTYAWEDIEGSEREAPALDAASKTDDRAAARYRWLAKQLLEQDVAELKAWLLDNITVHRRSMNEAIDAELLAEKEDAP